MQKNFAALLVAGGFVETMPQSQRCPLIPAFSPEGEKETELECHELTTGEAMFSTEQVAGCSLKVADWQTSTEQRPCKVGSHRCSTEPRLGKSRRQDAIKNA